MCLNTTKCEIAEKTSEIPTVIQTKTYLSSNSQKITSAHLKKSVLKSES